MLGFALVRVGGHSMWPTLADADVVLVRRYGARRRPRVGDVAVFRSNDGRLLVKRLVGRDGAGFRVRGDDVRSMTAVDLGPVAASRLDGYVVARLARGTVPATPRHGGDGPARRPASATEQELDARVEDDRRSPPRVGRPLLDQRRPPGRCRSRRRRIGRRVAIPSQRRDEPKAAQ